MLKVLFDVLLPYLLPVINAAVVSAKAEILAEIEILLAKEVGVAK